MSRLPSRCAEACAAALTLTVRCQHGADPNLRNNWLESPLHAAAYGGRNDLIPLLLAAGADPLALTEHGRSALDFALIGQEKGKFRKNFQGCVDALKAAEKEWHEKLAKEARDD